MKALITVLCGCIVFFTSSAQNTYTWNIAGGGSWSTSGNWSPARTSPAATDILIINNGGSKSITNVPTQTIGRLVIANNTSVTLSGGGGSQILTIANGSGSDFIIESGSTLIQNSSLETITLSANCSVNINGIFEVKGNYNTTASGAITSVEGELINSSFVHSSVANSLVFKNGSVYKHNRDGGTIPIATWESGSDVLITGVTNTFPGNFNQSFKDLLWNCPGQNTGFNLGGAITNITEDFEIRNTNNYGLFLANASGSTYNLAIGGDLILSDNSWLSITNGNNITATVNVAGNLIMSGGYFDYHVATSGSTTLNKIILNVNGDVSITGGYYDFAWGNSNAANFSELRIGGNLAISGTATFSTSTTDSDISNGTVFFNGPGNWQTFYAENPTNVMYVNFIVNNKLKLLSDRLLVSNTVAGWADQFTIQSGGSIDLSVFRIISSTGATAAVNSSFVLQAGAEVITANIAGLQLNATNGSISTAIANRAYSSGANYVYNGSAVQNSGIFTTTPIANQVNNLTVNNTAGTYSSGLILQQPIAINGNCQFTAGVITTSISDILIINDGATVSGANNNTSNPSFVNGPVRKTGNDPFIFPVGKLNAGYRPCGISAPSAITDVFTAEYMRSSATALGSVTAQGLQSVSSCEYWEINRTTGNSSVDVTLSWSSIVPCNPAVSVVNLNNITVAHFNGTTWNTHGSNAISGTVSEGSVTWNSVSNFSPFSLGISGTQVPLSVKFTNLIAFPSGVANIIEWTSNEESGVQDYEVQRSTDGNRFTTINVTAARNNNGSNESYSFRDENPGADKVFYRVKGNEINGTFKFSPIAKVVRSNSSGNDIMVYPNPVIGKQFSLQLTALEKGNYELRLVNSHGQQVQQLSLQHNGGYLYRSVELPVSLSPGIYYLLLTNHSYQQTQKIIVK